MRARDRPRDREPEAGAASGVINAMETIEDQRLLFGGDAAASIAYVDFVRVAFGTRADDDFAAVAVLDRVVD